MKDLDELFDTSGTKVILTLKSRDVFGCFAILSVYVESQYPFHVCMTSIEPHDASVVRLLQTAGKLMIAGASFQFTITIAKQCSDDSLVI